jgi:hypothetical protein
VQLWDSDFNDSPDRIDCLASDNYLTIATYYDKLSQSLHTVYQTGNSDWKHLPDYLYLPNWFAINDGYITYANRDEDYNTQLTGFKIPH